MKRMGAVESDSVKSASKAKDKLHKACERGASKSRNETKRNETKRNGSHTHKFTTSAQAHHSSRIFSCAVWLAPGLDTVSEVRLMLFFVYSLLWQLSILSLTVLESFSQCMLTLG